MKTRNIRKQFETVCDLGVKNLLVGGCSFTYNNSDDTSVTWPYYLRDLADIGKVYDCSLPGSGNYHICHSTMWACENLDLDANDTLVIIMWSGHDRDDFICKVDAIDNYPFVFNYTNNVVSGITGGNHGGGNVKTLKELDKTKNQDSRSVENYLYVVSLYNYLRSKKYKFLFLDYLDRSIPHRGHDFEIGNLLDTTLQKKYHSLFEDGIENLYRFAVKNDLLMEDDFHPTPDAHLRWTREHLLPCIIKKNQLHTVTP